MFEPLGIFLRTLSDIFLILLHEKPNLLNVFGFVIQYFFPSLKKYTGWPEPLTRLASLVIGFPIKPSALIDLTEDNFQDLIIFELVYILLKIALFGISLANP